MPEKSERELAIRLIEQLDSVPIDKARNALEHAILLLSETQIVWAKSPLLARLCLDKAS